MEAMKMKVFAVLMVVLMAFSTMQKATAADAPSPSPASDATIFVPAFLASFILLDLCGEDDECRRLAGAFSFDCVRHNVTEFEGMAYHVNIEKWLQFPNMGRNMVQNQMAWHEMGA
ncbi:hypothetical protein DKX38_005275 [Salix brachista]|uniref:Prolamin-like domain-containing protein n=1 Tax=Salix brachista TaxID=2182728 RepID=A0A5N5NFC0_9ROSI|nr:hypothetical protein DKX38_005275 [Salix brachista]